MPARRSPARIHRGTPEGTSQRSDRTTATTRPGSSAARAVVDECRRRLRRDVLAEHIESDVAYSIGCRCRDLLAPLQASTAGLHGATWGASRLGQHRGDPRCSTVRRGQAGPLGRLEDDSLDVAGRRLGATLWRIEIASATGVFGSVKLFEKLVPATCATDGGEDEGAEPQPSTSVDVGSTRWLATAWRSGLLRTGTPT